MADSSPTKLQSPMMNILGGPKVASVRNAIRAGGSVKNLTRQGTQISNAEDTNLEDSTSKEPTQVEKNRLLYKKLIQAKLELPESVRGAEKKSRLSESSKQYSIKSTPRITLHKKSKSMPSNILLVSPNKKANQNLEKKESPNITKNDNPKLLKMIDFMDSQFGYDKDKLYSGEIGDIHKKPSLRRGSTLELSVMDNHQIQTQREEPQEGDNKRVSKLIRKASTILRRRAMLPSQIDDKTKQDILVFNSQQEKERRYRHFKTFQSFLSKEEIEPTEKTDRAKPLEPLSKVFKEHLETNKTSTVLYEEYCEKKTKDLQDMLSERLHKTRTNVDKIKGMIKKREVVPSDLLSNQEHLLRRNIIQINRENYKNQLLPAALQKAAQNNKGVSQREMKTAVVKYLADQIKSSIRIKQGSMKVSFAKSGLETVDSNADSAEKWGQG